MSKQGAALQTYNNELVKHIEAMYSKRENLCAQINKEETEQRKLEQEMELLQQQLDKVKDSVAKNLNLKDEYDRVIKYSETAHMKILESSQVLLSVVKKESSSLTEQEENGV